MRLTPRASMLCVLMGKEAMEGGGHVDACGRALGLPSPCFLVLDLLPA